MKNNKSCSNTFLILFICLIVCINNMKLKTSQDFDVAKLTKLSDAFFAKPQEVAFSTKKGKCYYSVSNIVPFCKSSDYVTPSTDDNATKDIDCRSKGKSADGDLVCAAFQALVMNKWVYDDKTTTCYWLELYSIRCVSLGDQFCNNAFTKTQCNQLNTDKMKVDDVKTIYLPNIKNFATTVALDVKNSRKVESASFPIVSRQLYNNCLNGFSRNASNQFSLLAGWRDRVYDYIQVTTLNLAADYKFITYTVQLPEILSIATTINDNSCSTKVPSQYAVTLMFGDSEEQTISRESIFDDFNKSMEPITIKGSKFMVGKGSYSIRIRVLNYGNNAIRNGEVSYMFAAYK